jgi:hypothetical protein
MRKPLLILSLVFLLPSGCKKQPQIDYSALDQSGMWSTTLSEVKKMKLSSGEIAQLAALKRAGASDEFCVSLLKAARAHNHEFTSGDSAVTLSRAGYSDAQILEMAQADKTDVLSDDAVMLKLMGLSNTAVQTVIQRREQGLPTLTSEQIGRLKNTGMSEQKILEFVNEGLSGAPAEAEIKKLEATRDHSHTSFVHVRGRRPR